MSLTASFNKLPADAQQKFIALCNDMKQRHLVTYPYFFNLFQATVAAREKPNCQRPNECLAFNALKAFLKIRNRVLIKILPLFIEFSNYTFFKKCFVFQCRQKLAYILNWIIPLNTTKNLLLLLIIPTLSHLPHGDSMTIHQTGGVYYPLCNLPEARYKRKSGLDPCRAWMKVLLIALLVNILFNASNQNIP